MGTWGVISLVGIMPVGVKLMMNLLCSAIVNPRLVVSDKTRFGIQTPFFHWRDMSGVVVRDHLEADQGFWPLCRLMHNQKAVAIFSFIRRFLLSKMAFYSNPFAKDP